MTDRVALVKRVAQTIHNGGNPMELAKRIVAGVTEPVQLHYQLRVSRLTDSLMDATSELDDALDDWDALEAVVKAWHEKEHADGWAVCDHPVCREVVGAE